MFHILTFSCHKTLENRDHPNRISIINSIPKPFNCTSNKFARFFFVGFYPFLSKKNLFTFIVYISVHFGPFFNNVVQFPQFCNILFPLKNLVKFLIFLCLRLKISLRTTWKTFNRYFWETVCNLVMKSDVFLA